MAEIPQFDPSQAFEEVGAGAPPAFDPSKPFEEVKPDSSWSRAVTGVPEEAWRTTKEMAGSTWDSLKGAFTQRDPQPNEGFWEGYGRDVAAVPSKFGKAASGVMEGMALPVAPAIGAAKSLIGRPLAHGIHALGEYINPDEAVKQTPEGIYQDIRGDVGTAVQTFAPWRGKKPGLPSQEGEIIPPPSGPAGGAGGPGRGGPTIEGEYTSPTQERPGSGVRILPKDYAGTGREGDPYHDAAWAALGERGGAGATGVPGGPLANMHPKAIELAKEIFSEEGLSPWERDRRLEEMSPHQFGAEWSDSSRMAVSGLHRKGGEPATIIGPAFRGRKSETPERISGHFDEMFGPYKNLTEDQARINKERDAASRPFWNIFNKTRVEPTPRLEALRDALDASGAWAGAEKLLRIGRVPREQHLMVGGEDVMAPTAQFYQAAKMSIDAKIAKALKDEDGPLAMHLVGLKHELIGAINEHHNPDVAGKWKMALDTWAGPEAMKAAQDLGEKILTQHVKARDINTIVNSYGAPERAEIGAGIREYLEDRLGNPGNVDLGVINTVLGRNNIKKLKAIYGDEQVDKFVNTMLHEHDMHFSHDRIIRNSVTAEATNAAKRFDPAEKWYNSVGPGDVPRSLSQVAMKGFSKGVERLQKQQVEKAQQEQNKINADVARIMTLQGPERNAVIRYLTGGEPPEGAAPVINRANGGRVDPNNIHTFPSEAQKEAGNYAKDHVRIQGLDLTIENAKGSKRSGVDKGGKPWSVTLPHHYGYIKGSVGADKDHVDCYLGPHKNAPNVWIVDQQDADTKKFDEHKIMMGFASAQQARNCYLKAFSDGRGQARIKAMHEMTIGDFKEWLAKGDTTKAMAAA